MTYYDPLIAAWNSVTQPPAGVTGVGLLSGDTTAQKIAKVNAWTVTGSVPTNFTVTGAQILNCINWVEFNALTATQQANLLALCQVQGGLLGGSGNTAFLVDGMLLGYFTNHSGPTITALLALAQASVQTWSQVNGYGSGISLVSASEAGLT